MRQPAETEHVQHEQKPRWFAVHTRHQHENLVATNLRNKGIEVFLPTYEAVRRWSDRTKHMTLPLFPGYIFFANEIERWLQVVSTPGVREIIKVGAIPAEIPDDEIVAVRQMLNSRRRVEPHPLLLEGDLVRIAAGPLVGLQGIVSRKKDALRLVLSIQILGQSASVEIDGCVVERLGPSRPIIPQNHN